MAHPQIVGDIVTFSVTGQSPGAQSINVPEGATHYVFFWHAYGFTDLELESLSLSGQAATLAASEPVPGDSNGDAVGVAWGAVSATGTQSIQWTFTETLTQGPTISVVFLQGVDTNDPVRDAQAMHATTGTLQTDSVTLATAPTDLILGMVGSSNGSDGEPAGAFQRTLLDDYQHNFLDEDVAAKYPTGGESTDFFGTGDWLTISAIAFSAADPPDQAVAFEGATSAAYSAASGSSVAPAYPDTVSAGDLLVMIVGQRPSTANGGTATTPSGWTRGPELTGANDGNTGGYGSTIGADTGNMNIFSFYKEAEGTESGSESVSLSGNNVAWAAMLRFSKTGGTWNIAGATGKDTSAGNVSIAFSTDPGVEEGDFVIGAMAIPTDVTTPGQFSAHAFSQDGVTFGPVVEVEEPDSTTGNDIGGYITVARADDGESSGSPTMTATAGGTTTNVRGPGLFLRLRVASSQFEDISGSASVTVTATGFLRANAAISGSAAITVTPTAHLYGDAPISGEVDVEVAATGALVGDGALSGSASVAVTAVANPMMYGSAEAAVTATGTLTGDAALSGEASVTAATTGHLQGDGALASAVSPEVAASGTLTGTGALSGSASVTATATATPSMRGTSSSAFAATGTLTGDAGLSATVQSETTATGTLTGTGAMSGLAEVEVTATGRLVTPGGMNASVSVTTTADGTLTGDGALSGAASTETAASGLMHGDGELVGAASPTVSATGALVGTGQLAGSSSFSIAPTATLQGTANLSASVDASCAASGELIGTGKLAAVVPITAAPTARLRGSGAMSGSAQVTVTANASPAEDISGSASITVAASGTLTGDAALSGFARMRATVSGTMYANTLGLATATSRVILTARATSRVVAA